MRDASPETPGTLTAQAPPCATMELHTLAAQSAERHSAARSHAAPVGRLGVHVPLPQKSLAGQSLSFEQAVAPVQTCSVQLPTRHSASTVHGPSCTA
jgi:hypothetical protein